MFTGAVHDVLGSFSQGRHHPTALFVLRSLVLLLGEESVSGMFSDPGMKLTQLAPGGCVNGCVNGSVRWVCRWVYQIDVSCGHIG